MSENWDFENEIDPTIGPIYLTVGERYMLFTLAENENLPERTMLKQLIEQAYSRLNNYKELTSRG